MTIVPMTTRIEIPEITVDPGLHPIAYAAAILALSRQLPGLCKPFDASEYEVLERFMRRGDQTGAAALLAHYRPAGQPPAHGVQLYPVNDGRLEAGTPATKRVVAKQYWAVFDLCAIGLLDPMLLPDELRQHLVYGVESLATGLLELLDREKRQLVHGGVPVTC